MANVRNEVIRIDDRELRSAVRSFAFYTPRELRRAKRVALSRTRRGVKQRISTLVRERGERKYNVPARRVSRAVSMSPIFNDSFTVYGSNKPIPLISYSGRQGAPRDRRKSGGGVSVVIRDGRRVAIRSAFIAASTRNGARQVFRRTFTGGGGQVGRKPIDRLVGPAVATMMRVNNAQEDLADFLQERFDTELQRALVFALRRGR